MNSCAVRSFHHAHSSHTPPRGLKQGMSCPVVAVNRIASGAVSAGRGTVHAMPTDCTRASSSAVQGANIQGKRRSGGLIMPHLCPRQCDCSGLRRWGRFWLRACRTVGSGDQSCQLSVGDLHGRLLLGEDYLYGYKGGAHRASAGGHDRIIRRAALCKTVGSVFDSWNPGLAAIM